MWEPQLSFSQKLQELYIRHGSRSGCAAAVMIVISINVVADVIERCASKINDVSLSGLVTVKVS